MSTTVTEGASPLPCEARIRELPYLITKLVIGCRIHSSWHDNDDAVGVEYRGDTEVYNIEDVKVSQRIADEIKEEYCIPSGISTLSSFDEVLSIHKMAQDRLRAEGDFRADKKGLAMLKDQSGSGYWRMVLPSKYLNLDDTYIDVTSAPITFENLLEYETIFVQRMHDWDSYYMLKKLKDAGKRLVYDIDDDIFNIPPSNPAYHVLTRDAQTAALACMGIADVVTTTSSILGERIQGELPNTAIKVIPNALELGEGWIDLENIGSPDGNKRIFWQGSATHEEDWIECIEAIDAVMQERDNVILTILGYLPSLVQARLGLPHWQGRVEYLGFNDSETYFNLIKHIRADVGIAPLQLTPFNQAKSPIKWIEYSMMGIPTVASDVEPYNLIMESSKSGLLVRRHEEWKSAIDLCFDNKDEAKNFVKTGREIVNEKFDISKMAASWEAVLCP
jgi:glycosyltransferase involved in cell wall biosynthesis